MELVGKFIGGLNVIFIACCLVILVFLIFKKRKIRSKEDFDKREN